MPRRPNELDWAKRPERVEVEWVDSEGGSGWHPIAKERDEKPRTGCATVGYLFERTRSHVKIVQSLSENENVDNVLTIPRSAIRKVTVLSPKEPR
jgi:hypothetical protein